MGWLEFVGMMWCFLQGKGQLTTFRFSVFSLTGPLHPPPPILTHRHTKSLSFFFKLPLSNARTHRHTHIPTLSTETVCEQTTGGERKRGPSVLPTRTAAAEGRRWGRQLLSQWPGHTFPAHAPLTHKHTQKDEAKLPLRCTKSAKTHPLHHK